MRYFTQPPKPSNPLPDFVSKWYKKSNNPINTEYIINLMAWAEMEFIDWRSYFIVQRNLAAIKKIRNYNCLHFLSQTKEFKFIVDNMTDEIWNSFPKAIRDSLYKTYKIYATSGA